MKEDIKTEEEYFEAFGRWGRYNEEWDEEDNKE